MNREHKPYRHRTESQRKVDQVEGPLVCTLLAIEIFWVINFLMIYISPSVEQYVYPSSDNGGIRVYYQITPVIDVPCTKGFGYVEEEAINMAQHATWPALVLSLLAVLLTAMSLVWFHQHETLRRCLWGASIIVAFSVFFI